MKKTLLLFIAFLMTIYSFANSITINNNSNATFYYSLRGEEVYNDGTTYFESPEILIAPGDVVHFDNPSEVPGLEYLDSTATFIFIKGSSPDCPNVDLTDGCQYSLISYPYPSMINNVCPPSISLIAFTNMTNNCTSDIIVNIL